MTSPCMWPFVCLLVFLLLLGASEVYSEVMGHCLRPLQGSIQFLSVDGPIVCLSRPAGRHPASHLEASHHYHLHSVEVLDNQIISPRPQESTMQRKQMSSDSLGQLSCQELGQELGSQPSRDYNFSATPQLAENFCDFCEPLWQMRPAQGGDQKARKVRRFLMFFTNIHMHLYTHTHTVSHIYISTQTPMHIHGHTHTLTDTLTLSLWLD